MFYESTILPTHTHIQSTHTPRVQIPQAHTQKIPHTTHTHSLTHKHTHPLPPTHTHNTTPFADIAVFPILGENPAIREQDEGVTVSVSVCLVLKVQVCVCVSLSMQVFMCV